MHIHEHTHTPYPIRYKSSSLAFFPNILVFNYQETFNKEKIEKFDTPTFGLKQLSLLHHLGTPPAHSYSCLCGLGLAWDLQPHPLLNILLEFLLPSCYWEFIPFLVSPLRTILQGRSQHENLQLKWNPSIIEFVYGLRDGLWKQGVPSKFWLWSLISAGMVTRKIIEIGEAGEGEIGEAGLHHIHTQSSIYHSAFHMDVHISPTHLYVRKYINASISSHTPYLRKHTSQALSRDSKSPKSGILKSPTPYPTQGSMYQTGSLARNPPMKWQEDAA